MSESLLQKLKRMQDEIDTLRLIKPPKQTDYSEGISLLEQANKELSKRFFDLDLKYSELNKKLYKINDDILKLNNKIDLLNDKINKPASTPAPRVIDNRKELLQINNEINLINKNISTLEKIDIKSKIEKIVTEIVTEVYITKLYGNK